MLYNYLKIAYRNIIRNKTFSTINILGLALGMASSLLLLLWVQDELRIGRQHANTGLLYRIMENEIADGRIVTDEDTPGLLPEELKRQFSEVAYAAGISSNENHVLSAGEKISRQSGCYAGADWFNMYSIPLLTGTSQSALSEPGNIAISRKTAETFFKNAQAALGQVIRIDNHTDYKVSAVFEDLPDNSTDKYDFLLNWKTFLKREPWLNVWENGGPGTRIQLRPGTDPDKVNAKLKTFLKGRNKDISPSFNIELFLQPEAEVYLYSNFKNGHRDGGRIEYVRLFIIVAAFLLLIAGINFMNLATARSVKRAREVGVRKAIGAERRSLIWQFMNEALLMTALAAIVAIIAVWISLPVFNQLTGKQLSLPIGNFTFWMLLAAILLVTAGVSGSYPALFLSSIRPVRVLKGTLHISAGSQLFRRGLVVFQFVLSILMIVGTIVVYQQLQYVQTKNLGYDRENLVVIRGEGEIAQKYQVFKQQLLQLAGIQSVTYMQTSPLQNGNTTDGVQWSGKEPGLAIQFNNTSVGYDFVKTMKLQLVRGRDFSPEFGTDSANYLINESTAKRLGYKDPIGQPLTFGKHPGIIVGLLKDFHFNSLHVPIRPIIIRLNDQGAYGNILIRTQPGQVKQALSNIEAVCRKMNPTFPFSYSFVDEEFMKVYKSEAVVGKLITLFACLSIFIACLGLFGLAAFMAEQRTKEIGIRKVFGASVASIVTLLSRDFIKLVLIAILIASPLAWYATAQWLETFTYKISLSWPVFVIAGLSAITIAVLTISFQSIRAALVNPVNSLKGE
ncbi:ABC transporter permease [Chitinophaga tropicalis]|uniref:FtsX-like permease family protein n=1 Tax=Chitinophaga tropicalis TaxID=2683588 RepID=A0A7K1U3Z4_9BACT|nr:ABC transporter permease [Chitinophaga tropicalis]MVT09083.1 FtsX-like permease family protein [Chitinophaga tropicalis]